ncbi:hypothetical protein BY996DRAFT_6576190 [Phakopsora pachyrhizi]|nr:hypothetical protein BY996DRAFT_6576190 [Phakopsora pachyrhizi]
MKSYRASSSGGFDCLVNSSLQSETDVNFLEGGRLMKTIQDLIEKVREENIAGQDNQLKTFEEGIEELKTEDGRAVLNTARHNGMVRGQLNKLSMNLSGLADQVSNELSLLTWIKDEPAKLFGSTSKEIRLDLEQLRFQLDGLEMSNLKSIVENNGSKSLSVADQLESFINSCPSTSTSLIRDQL